MKIGILTFHCAVNYGAVLQTYALSEYLKTLGHDVSVINYRPEYLLHPYRVVKHENFIPGITNTKKWVRELGAIAIRCSRAFKFRRFLKKHLKLEDLQLDSKENDFDAFVFGSDQIWNPKLTGLDHVYLGRAKAFEGKRMIVYAASAGSVNNFSVSDWAILQDCLIKFEAISVRENQLKEALCRKLSISCHYVLDPVLMAGRETFDAISHSIKKRPYLLCMSLSDNGNMKRCAQSLATRKGLQLVIIASMTEFVSRIFDNQSVSIERFIDLFKGADYVVTSSFHGTVFSILYEKNFIVWNDNAAVSERAESLLGSLGLEDRLVTDESWETIVMKPINWDCINACLLQLREMSREFLKDSLKIAP